MLTWVLKLVVQVVLHATGEECWSQGSISITICTASGSSEYPLLTVRIQAVQFIAGRESGV